MQAPLSTPPHDTPSQGQRSSIKRRTASFGFALLGIRALVATQVHARFHLAASIGVVAAGLYFGLAPWEWASVLLAIGGVWMAEALNTALELLVDLVHPAWHERAGIIKDLAAGAVLLFACAALGVALVVFGPRILSLVG